MASVSVSIAAGVLTFGVGLLGLYLKRLVPERQGSQLSRRIDAGALANLPIWPARWPLSPRDGDDRLRGAWDRRARCCWASGLPVPSCLKLLFKTSRRSTTP